MMIKYRILSAVMMLFSWQLFAQQVDDVTVKLMGPSNLNYRKAPKRVLISDFEVQYQTALQLEDKKKGGKMWRGGLKGDAKAGLTVILEGLDEQSLVEVTNKLYAQYVDGLQAAGYEVAPIEELWNHKLYTPKREERWELMEGGKATKGNAFGAISVRPSGQRFVVARQVPQQEGSSPLAAMGSLTSYVTKTENKLVTQKNDFIYNKVVVVVNVFENAMSETERTLNRHAGYAEVKVETNFNISDKSYNRLGGGNIIPKKSVEVKGVLAHQKFDAAQAANTDKRGTDWGVVRVWQVEHREDINVEVVECDPQAYTAGAEAGGKAFLAATLEKLKSKS